jgi:hypothetical protein
MSSGTSTSKSTSSSGKHEKKGEIQFTAELEEILKRITEIKNIAGSRYKSIKGHSNDILSEFIFHINDHMQGKKLANMFNEERLIVDLCMSHISISFDFTDM